MKDRLLQPQEILELLHKEKHIPLELLQTSKLRVRANSEEGAISQVGRLELKSALAVNIVFGVEFLTEWLSKYFDLPYFRIDPLKIRPDVVTAVMSLPFAQRHRILCVDVQPEFVVMATSEPLSKNWITALQHTIRKEIKLVLANPVTIKRYQAEFYQISRSVKGANVESRDSNVNNFEQLVELGRAGEVDANDQHVVRIVDWILQYAFDQRASDIHIEPRREQSFIRFRIDGVLQKVYDMPASIGIAVVARMKILGRMDVSEKRRPLDGRIKSRTPDGQEVELRLSTLPTAFGEKLVARIFDPNVLVKKFAQLGLERQTEKRWLQLIESNTGIVLVTGPTGSGKTTTLYTSLKHLATPEVNVSTIEDPIEMVEGSFNQMQVQSDLGVTFANGVRALMRQDPDIIMVGEIRDIETAEMAIQASLTGHLVLSTLHTNDAATAVQRLMDIGVPPYMINATVIGIMAQRLVRTLCPHCKQETSPDEEAWNALVKPFDLPVPETMFRPKGCDECRQTGYRGRQGIYELLMLTPTVQKLIHKDCDVRPIREQAIKEGMNLLRISGAYKVAGGLTTIEEVIRNAPPPDFD